MPGPNMTLAEVAAELGRSPDWLGRQWANLCQTDDMPLPVRAIGMLAWNRAQFYAWLDRDLPPEMRTSAMAYRAAAAAAAAAHHIHPDTIEQEASRARLDDRLGLNR